MRVVGIDLGVRSFHAALLDGDDLDLSSSALRTPKKVADQGAWERADELAELCRHLRTILLPGDCVFIEEPPNAGSRNLRTFLKLGQTCGALASQAVLVGAAVSFVPVDVWKKAVVGKGGVDKDTVRRALTQRSSRYSALCDNDQNYVDATCIALFGQAALAGGDDAEHLGTGRKADRQAG